MADDIAVTPGTGATVAADDIGGGKLAQRVKQVVGADGIGVDVQPAVPTTVASGTGNVAAVATACSLMGWSFRENAAATAALIIRDGSGGTVIAEVTLAAGESIRDVAPGAGIRCLTGVYIERTSGTTKGSVWTVS